MSDSGQERRPDRVRFHYLKSPAFHTIHADGGIGGLTPTGDFHLGIYAQRFPIPTQTEHEMAPEGAGEGKEILDARVARDGVVRELLVDIVFDYRAANAFRKWLDDQIRLHDEVSKRSENRPSGGERG